ncbi:MAG: hypothetical protein JETT_0124 [Candidatus Jettenia ecosi]|uniref:Uncharacterized protein n=1 Tax=Candidatus Jettenia ecosi TaxID=2494326 RepID=A0A533QFE2_9BACT|nr:MAG: hypothetical protein JETT_0124 [Candidatus Jettenia ecosi]
MSLEKGRTKDEFRKEGNEGFPPFLKHPYISPFFKGGLCYSSPFPHVSLMLMEYSRCRARR